MGINFAALRSIAFSPAILTAGVLVFMSGWCARADAQSISNVAFVNTSTPNASTGALGISRSLQTANILGDVLNTPAGSSFSTHFVYSNALRVIQPEGPEAPLVNFLRPQFDLTFSIDVSDARAYRITAEVITRGYITMQSDTLEPVIANSGDFAGSIDTNLDDGVDTLGGARNMVLNLTILNTLARPMRPFDNVLVTDSRTYTGPVLSGGRRVGITYENYAFCSVGFVNGQAGELAARFGLNPIQPIMGPLFTISGYPGVDNELESSHGFFLTVRVTACKADLDRSGAVTSEDFFAFLVAFFSGDADYNDDGTTSSADFFEFVTDFLSGC